MNDTLPTQEELETEEMHEADAATSKTVREFSPAGPCITKGEFVKRTKKFIFYRDRYNNGEIRRVGGWKVEERDGSRGYVHTEPCPSCRDHERTQYPNGYDN